MSTRYYVFSKKSPSKKPLKNAQTREEARSYKRSQSNPANFGIYDRVYGEVIR